MKLILTNDELAALVRSMRDYSANVTFNTLYESRVTGQILRDFITRISKKSLDLQKKYIFSLDPQTTLALNEVLPQIYPDSPFDRVVIQSIHLKVNQSCLNI